VDSIDKLDWRSDKLDSSRTAETNPTTKTETHPTQKLASKSFEIEDTESSSDEEIAVTAKVCCDIKPGFEHIALSKRSSLNSIDSALTKIGGFLGENNFWKKYILKKNFRKIIF